MKRFIDERLQNSSRELMVRIYPLMIFLIFLGAACKFFFISRSLDAYLLEFISILSPLYLLIEFFRNRAVFSDKGDECTTLLKRKYYYRAFMICFCVYVFGNLYYIYEPSEMSAMIPVVNLMAYAIPSIIVTILLIKRGLFLPSPRMKNERFRKLKKKSITAGIAYGIFMSWYLGARDHGETSWVKYVCMAILLGSMFGYFWYFAMKLMMKWSSKRADCALEKQDHEEK